MFEKIKINLSYKTYNQIISDLESFSFYKENGETNLNLFMNIVINGMYERNRELNSLMLKDIESSINLNTYELDKISEVVYKALNKRFEDNTNRSVGYYISYRPSKKYEDLYNEIELNELTNTTISNYFRSLLNEYASLSQDQREQIVFKDTIKVITSAINNKNYLTLKDKNLTSFIPYKIVKTNDELYNYVIGAKRINGYFHPFSLHIYKCSSIVKEKNHYTLTDDEEKQFKKIIVTGPREIEIRSGICEVELTQNGIKQFKRFYLNRPIPTKIVDNHYFFDSSFDNIIIYFSRFGSNAKIISPEHLKNRMKNFYKHAYNNYNK